MSSARTRHFQHGIQAIQLQIVESTNTDVFLTPYFIAVTCFQIGKTRICVDSRERHPRPHLGDDLAAVLLLGHHPPGHLVEAHGRLGRRGVEAHVEIESNVEKVFIIESFLL
jgi:hypothetical protein